MLILLNILISNMLLGSMQTFLLEIVYFCHMVRVGCDKYQLIIPAPWSPYIETCGKQTILSFVIGYWHQVRSYGSKNMAVSVLFSRLKEFNATGCNNRQHTPSSLANAGMVWTYPGYGPQTLGNSDPFEVRYIMID